MNDTIPLTTRCPRCHRKLHGTVPNPQVAGWGQANVERVDREHERVIAEHNERKHA